ncbi:MAG: DegT/DnrJ/EryC1/StrS family aminotransferase [Anaerolineae bacterium]|nr:DegT/DnrJ/EryC1/StrS family aminotransferase [Anaerolineae bacterium]
MEKPFEPRSEFLIFGSPLIMEEDIQEVVATLRSGWIGTGPKVARFEAAFRELIGCRHAIAVNSCTAALSLALDLAEVGSGDEVITTPMTFAATANVIGHHGAQPVFADVDRASGNILPKEIERHITPKTKVLMPVHLAGRPCQMDRIMEIARAHNLLVIEDAAHAIEAYYQGAKVGNIGDFAAFSFYPTKSLTTAEGGMLTTNRDEWAEKARLLHLHGISADAWKRYSDAGYTHYETVLPGYKYNLSDLQAALALHQMERLEQNLHRREAIWQLYDRGLAGLNGLILPPPVESDELGKTVHARHLYTVMVDPAEAGFTRDDVMRRLKDVNIGTGVHYVALHMQHFYRETYGYQPDDFPNARWISDRTLSLPLTAKMTLTDAEDVIAAIRWIWDRS